VAADLTLAPFDPAKSIWETFPRAYSVGPSLAGSSSQKVALARGGIQLSGGNHFPRFRALYKTFTTLIPIHHFKWDATLIERLRYRVRPEWQAKCPWWVESQRLLDYFAAHQSRFDPADLVPICVNAAEPLAFD
jgi:hypothetical protein